MIEAYKPAYATRLIPPDPESAVWGISVSHSAFVTVPPGGYYPPRQDTPRADIACFWRKGLATTEYQIIYISGGRGTFESRETGQVPIQSGQVIIVFPGIWHRYRPDKSTGWEESRLAFTGTVANQIMTAFFSPAQAVVTIGQSRELEDLIRSIAGIVDQAPACCHQIAAARTMEVIALIRSLSKMSHPVTDRHTAEKLRGAIEYLNRHYNEQIDVDKLAVKLGVSESRLRTIFRLETGFAPYQYLLNIRINLARHWLTESNLTITEIAEKLGFSSVFYFSRLFKNKVGCPPSEYRKR